MVSNTAGLEVYCLLEYVLPCSYSWESQLTRKQQLCGYVVTTWLVHRFPPGKLLCSASLLWSIITMLYAACNSWAGFMALRFVMGFVESAIAPCLTMLVVSFYKKQEQPQRNASKVQLVENGDISGLPAN